VKTDIHFLPYLAHFFFEREMFQTRIKTKIKAHFMFKNFFLSENLVVYEIRWKNILEQGRPQKTTRRMRIACWIIRLQRHTLRICNNYCFSSTTMVERTRLTVTLYIYCLSCSLYGVFPSARQPGVFKAFLVLFFVNGILCSHLNTYILCSQYLHYL